MFNRTRRFGRRTSRVIRLIWRDAQAVSVFLLYLSAGMICSSTIVAYRLSPSGFVLLNAMMGGVILGFAIFSTVHLFHRQAAREAFEEWSRGCLQRLTDEYNAAMHAEMLKKAGGENAGQQIH